MRKSVFLLVVLVCSMAGYGQVTTEGSLLARGSDGRELGACPLKSTAVAIEISGFIARVNVTQEFENSFTAPIEAVYVFPLSHGGAVDSMTMTVGGRIIRGRIMKREEARQTYEAAKSSGQAAALLDQERDNIFTQSVANIMPGERIRVEISYIETLKYENGAYELVFPMTVGPRYNPLTVKDAAKISPPVVETRNGSDVTIDVVLNAGVPVEAVRSPTHEITELTDSATSRRISLKNEKVIPNKDFILRYDVTGKRIEDGILTHRDKQGGFFTLMLQPPDIPATEDRTPKEIVFVLDTSGSMSGFPLEKAKEAMRLSLDGLYPEDTFNLITFAGDTAILFEKPVPATRANLDAAQRFLDGRTGGGGTEMMKAIKAALDPSDSSDHLRIVCFMTDAFVGNDDEIVAEIQRHPNARVFGFGIGGSVNRSLLERMTKEGKGDAEFVGLEDDGSAAAKRFYERVRTPMLTDLSIDWNGAPVADVYPSRLTDLFSSKPVIVHGRFTKPSTGSIKLRGKVAGAPYEREIQLNLPEAQAANGALATLWARTRIDDLNSQRLKAAGEKAGLEIEKAITSVGLEYGLMTAYTSFVAVEERIANPGAAPTKVVVPSVLPAGLSKENATDSAGAAYILQGSANSVVDVSDTKISTKARRRSKKASGRGNGGGSGSGTGYGSGMAATSMGATSGGSRNLNPSPIGVTTTVSAASAQTLPRGTSFTSILRVSPGVSSAGQFTVDGAAGPENVFVVDATEAMAAPPVTPGAAMLSARTLAIVRPEYPAAALESQTSGEVKVEIRVGRDGAVTEAKAISGPSALAAPAVEAAKLSRFRPVIANEKIVRIRGTLVYKFVSKEEIAIELHDMKAEPLSADDLRAARIDSKMHIWIGAVIGRLADHSIKPMENESKFVRDGIAAVRIELKGDAGEAMAALKAAGLTVTSIKGKMVAGRIPVAGLALLADLDAVQLVLPSI